MQITTPTRKEKRTIKQDTDRLAAFRHFDNREGKRAFNKLAKSLRRRIVRKEMRLSDFEHDIRYQAQAEIEKENAERRANRKRLVAASR